MKILRNKFAFLLLIFFSIFISCHKEYYEDTVSDSVKDINNWILRNMQALYLWNNKLPSGLNPGKEPDPKEFFYKMVYKAEDKWSYITPDLDKLIADLDGVPLSVGISPAFVRISEKQILLIVEFVYPGSPADKADIQRGDIILTIDGQFLTPVNYFDLFNKSNITVRKGIFSGGNYIPSGEPIPLISEIIEADPVIHHEIMDINGIKTGYLVYTHFTSGANDEYLRSLDDVFQSFMSEGITELIIDLRYNKGGENIVAGYFASAIAPASVVIAKEILVQYQYNSDLTAYFQRPGTDDKHLNLRFSSNINNLNLGKVYFLTSKKTASASELVIISLKPYMNVITIGEATYGKYAGSWLLNDNTNPPKHKWAMMPIVMKFANKTGYTDFIYGLTPDFLVTDYLLDLKSFGDPGDPLLIKAKELIGGLKSTAELPVKYDLPVIRIEDDFMKRGSILIMKNAVPFN